MNIMYHVKAFGLTKYAEAVFDDFDKAVKYAKKVYDAQLENYTRFSNPLKYTEREFITADFEFDDRPIRWIIERIEIDEYDYEYDPIGVEISIIDFITSEES